MDRCVDIFVHIREESKASTHRVHFRTMTESRQRPWRPRSPMAPHIHRPTTNKKNNVICIRPCTYYTHWNGAYLALKSIPEPEKIIQARFEVKTYRNNQWPFFPQLFRPRTYIYGLLLYYISSPWLFRSRLLQHTHTYIHLYTYVYTSFEQKLDGTEITFWSCFTFYIPFHYYFFKGVTYSIKTELF